MATQTYAPGDLLIGDQPIKTVPVTILSGEELKRGDVIGKVTASKKYILSLAAAGDGSEVPTLILAVDVDATVGDVKAVAYASCEVDDSKLVFGTGHTIVTFDEALRDSAAPIYLKTLA